MGLPLLNPIGDRCALFFPFNLPGSIAAEV